MTQQAQEFVYLPAKHLIKWGTKTRDGKIFDKNCVWLSPAQMVKGVSATIEGDERNPIGIARLSIDAKGVLRTIEISDYRRYMDYVDGRDYQVGWVPNISEYKSEWRDDNCFITSVVINRVSLLPSTLLLREPDPKLRIVK